MINKKKYHNQTNNQIKIKQHVMTCLKNFEISRTDENDRSLQNFLKLFNFNFNLLISKVLLTWSYAMLCFDRYAISNKIKNPLFKSCYFRITIILSRCCASNSVRNDSDQVPVTTVTSLAHKRTTRIV